MRPRDDIEGMLTNFGEKLRGESDLADRVRERLEFSAKPVSAGSSSWLGGLTMRQRITLGGLGAAAAVCLVAFLASYLSARPVFAQAVEKIREAKSFSFELVMEPTKPEIPGNTRQKMYWQMPGSCRMESFRTGGDEPGEVSVLFADKPGIHINHQTNTYRTAPARQGARSPLLLLHDLGRYSGEAKRKLGRKQIGGNEAEGFEIDIAKIDPSVPSGSVELWVDVKTMLPSLIKIQQGELPVVMRMENIKWNEKLSAKLFDAEPPEGYTDKTRPEEDIKSKVAKITTAMKLYAELSGGHYPKVKVVYGDVTRDEMFRMAGIEIPPKPEQHKDKRYAEILDATNGLARISVTLRDNPDAEYHGINVGPKDAEEVLLRWKLPDGRYQVIYGDLRSEAVTAERLKEIE